MRGGCVDSVARVRYLQPGLGGGCWRNIGPDWHTRLCADFSYNHRRSGAGKRSDKDDAETIFRFLAQGLMTRFVRLCYKTLSRFTGDWGRSG